MTKSAKKQNVSFKIELVVDISYQKKTMFYN